jgi:hypothetical protein
MVSKVPRANSAWLILFLCAAFVATVSAACTTSPGDCYTCSSCVSNSNFTWLKAADAVSFEKGTCVLLATRVYLPCTTTSTDNTFFYRCLDENNKGSQTTNLCGLTPPNPSPSCSPPSQCTTCYDCVSQSTYVWVPDSSAILFEKGECVQQVLDLPCNTKYFSLCSSVSNYASTTRKCSNVVTVKTNTTSKGSKLEVSSPIHSILVTTGLALFFIFG